MRWERLEQVKRWGQASRIFIDPQIANLIPISGIESENAGSLASTHRSIAGNMRTW